MAGKQNEQPMAAITTPSEPDLSPNRVTKGSMLAIYNPEEEVRRSVNSVLRYRVK